MGYSPTSLKGRIEGINIGFIKGGTRSPTSLTGRIEGINVGFMKGVRGVQTVAHLAGGPPSVIALRTPGPIIMNSSGPYTTMFNLLSGGFRK